MARLSNKVSLSERNLCLCAGFQLCEKRMSS